MSDSMAKWVLLALVLALTALFATLAYESRQGQETQRECIRAGGSWQRTDGWTTGCAMPDGSAR